MAITGATAGVVRVEVYASKLIPLKQNTKIADGSEQTVLEFADVGTVSGHIDLHNMADGDTVVLRQYIKLKEAGAYSLYAEEIYDGEQARPVVFITPKPTDVGLRITLQQTAGVLKSFDCNFMKEL